MILLGLFLCFHCTFIHSFLQSEKSWVVSQVVLAQVISEVGESKVVFKISISDLSPQTRSSEHRRTLKINQFLILIR